MKTFYENLAEHNETSKSVKCSISELKEIISLRSTKFPQNSEIFSCEVNETMKKTKENAESIQVKQFKSSHFPGILIRGVRANNSNNLISDYPLTKNFTSLNSINQETLKSLLTVEEIGQEGIVSQTEKIAMNLRNTNTTKNFSTQKRKLKLFFQSKNYFFPLRNHNKSYAERFRCKIEEEIKKNYEEEEECLIKLEGGIEKKMRKSGVQEHTVISWKKSNEDKDLMSKMEKIMKKYHKKAASFV